MIEKYVTDLAIQMGMNPPKISIAKRKPVGNCNGHLINISDNWKSTKAVVYYSEIADLENGTYSDKLETRVRSALSRLQMKFEPLTK